VTTNHEMTPINDVSFQCTCGVIGRIAEMNDHLMKVTREEADAALATVWTLVCRAEERDYTDGELDQIIGSCMLVFKTLRAVFGAKTREGDLDREWMANKVDKHRIDHGDFVRAGGDVTCKVCGHIYYDHPVVVGFGWLRRACDGRLLKL
jgi:hypothetical protein